MSKSVSNLTNGDWFAYALGWQFLRTGVACLTSWGGMKPYIMGDATAMLGRGRKGGRIQGNANRLA
jgi:hypothetical protein